MAYRELFVVEIREVLRLWQKGYGYRRIARLASVDRKTARRYVEAAAALGLERDPLAEAASDEVIAALVSAIRPGPSSEPGAMRQRCRDHRNLIEGWLREGCKAPKIVRLLARHSGVVVPVRTLQRFIAEELDRSPSRASTVRVADTPAGQVLEVDFAELGLFDDLVSGRRRKLHALICTAARSRHTFVWPCLTQTQDDVIEGLEAAWSFFGGVFAVLLPDNLKAVVEYADPLSPRFSQSFVEYAQARGFVIDPARVRKPRDKARVERTVRYARDDFFRGERFGTLLDARESAARWCREVAGVRVHGTTRREPLQHFEKEELPVLLPAPNEPYDVPHWTTLKVGRDHCVTVEHALYSVPQDHRRQELRVRVDRATVKLYRGAVFLKAHPRVAEGEAQIDPADLPAGTAELATRDGAALRRKAEAMGPSVGEYARRLLDDPRPWSRMRHLYRLLNLGKRYGNSLLNEACEQALALDVIDASRIDRMLERGLPGRRRPSPSPPALPSNVIPLRFARAPETYRARRPDPPGDTDAPA